MKNNFLVSICISALFLLSCEKDDKITPAFDNHTSLQNTSAKQKAQSIEKSGEFPPGYWDDVDNFVLTFYLGNSYNSSMEAEKALYYLESTVDFQLTGDESNTVERRKYGEQLEYTRTATKNGANWELSRTQINNLYNTIYGDLTSQASVVASSANQDVLVDIVDFEWEYDDQNGQIILTVNGIYGLINNNLALPQTCILEEAKATYRQRCNGASYVRDAAEEINFYLRPLCGVWNNKISCNLSNSIILNPVTSVYNALTPCGNYVNAEPYGTCRTAAENQGDFDSTRNVWNTQCFPGLNKIRSAGYRGENRWWTSTTYHWASFYTATGCKKICGLACNPLPPTPPLRPRPIFNP